MGVNSKLRPVLQLLLNVMFCSFWLQAKRVAAKIYAVVPFGRLRKRKTLAIDRQRITSVHRTREVVGFLKRHAIHCTCSKGVSCVVIRRPALAQSRSSMRSM